MTASKIQYPDGASYSGPIRQADGLPHGLGEKLLADGSRYKGNFGNGLFEGLGVMEFMDGSRYEGEFMNGKFHGVGVFTNSLRLTFRGEFRNGNISGKGQVTFPDGTHGLRHQEGDFQNGLLTTQNKCPMVIEHADAKSKEAKSIAASL